MIYTDFVFRGNTSLAQLNNVFQALKSANIDELFWIYDIIKAGTFLL